MRIPGSFFLQNLIERRALLYQLVRRDFQQRYIGSAAGWLWGLIHPLVLLGSWIFVFQICIQVKLPRGEVTENYAMFLLCGFLPWLLFQETVQRSSASLVEHSGLITKTVFPAEMIPVAIFVSSLIGHLMTLVLVVAAVAVILRHFSVMVLLLPLYMLVLGLLAVGVGWLVSSLHVYLRDTAQVVLVLLTLWFWLTPIFISEQMYPPPVRFLLSWNPMAYLVRAYRDRLLSLRLPSLEEFAVPAALGLAAFVAGGLTFRHLKRGFADVL
jgi:lipopolysaccharide transport system permease protein